MDADPLHAVEQTPSPAELLAARRREARRKKILENSNNRLSKIVGPNSPLTTSSADAATDDEPTFLQPESIIYPDPEDERVVYEGIEHDPFQASTEQQDFSTMNGLMNGQNGDIFQLLNRLNQMQGNEGQSMGSAAAPVRHARLRRILHTKVHLMIAAMIVYLLFATGSERFIGGSVFLPLLAWEVIELLTLGSSDSNVGGPLLSLVLMFGGIPMRTSKMLQTVAGTINKVLKDVTFFVFFFVLTHLLWSRFGLGLELRYVLGYDQLEPSMDDTLMPDGVLS